MQKLNMPQGSVPTPGIYTDVPFHDYLHWPMMSQSVLKQGRKSMAHLKAAVDGIRLVDVTDDMQQGSAMHTAFLEPERFDERVICWKGQRRYGKEWDAFCDEHPNQIILTPGYYDGVVGMVKALREHPEVKRWAGRIQQVELSAVGEIDGVMCRARCDALTDDPLWDLKKVNDGSDRAIATTIFEYGYHIQGYIYRRLFSRDRFCLGLVEDKPPYDVRVVELGEEWMRIGKLEATDLLRRWKECCVKGVWPGRSDTIELVRPPTWATEQFGDMVTIGGEKAFA